jgi:hypothetical protein
MRLPTLPDADRLPGKAGEDGLTGRQPKAAADALAALIHRRGLKRASEALVRWAS